MTYLRNFCIGVFVICDVVVASQPHKLEYDPFSYLEVPKVKPTRNASTAVLEVKNHAWHPELRATIVAGAMSLANINGTVLRIGEELDGFTLTKVGNKTATFEKNQSRVILNMTPKKQKK